MTNGKIFEKNQSHIWTALEVKEFLKIPLSTLYELTKRGEIKGVKIGKHWRYLASDIHAFFLGLPGRDNSPFGSGEKFLSNRHSTAKDRRLVPRLNCELAAQLSILIGRKKESITGWIHNICVEGACFLPDKSKMKLTAGDPVRVLMEIPRDGTTQKIEAEGRIVYGRGSDSPFGLKFRTISEDQKGVIQHYVG